MDIQASSGMQQMQAQFTPQAMTDESKTAAAEIIAKYDSTNMTSSDTESMKAELKDANIRPSKELGSMLEDAGFEVEKPTSTQGAQGTQGGPPGGGRPPGPPPGGGKAEASTEVDESSDIYEELMEALEAEDDEAFIELAKKATGNLDASGVFVDKQA